MIRVFLGNLGSGKTACAVKEIMDDESGRLTYTNTRLIRVPNTVFIRPCDVIQVVKDKDNEKKRLYQLNVEYWKKQKKPLNVLWDEIHLTASARRSMSKANLVLSQFLAMARRITGFDKRGYGCFTFVAQKERTIDVNIRELCNEIIYHISYWKLTCEDCGRYTYPNSEQQQILRCLACGSWNVQKSDLYILRMFFNKWENYYRWCEGEGGRFHFKRQFVYDIEDYFKHYDTLQISNIWDSHVLG